MLSFRFATLMRNDIPYYPRIVSLNISNLHTSSCLAIKRLTRKSDKCEPPKIAVILSGCGALDGTEISEAMSAMIHISEKGMTPRFFAPDVDICEVIDHYTKEPDCGGPRNALVESARIARFCVKPLCECEACSFAGLIIPGGFGAVRTLSDFATKGCECTLIPELEKVLQDFSCDKKPIATICISSVLVARLMRNVKITLGKDCPKEDWPYSDAIEIAKQMGAKLEMRDVRGVTRCKKCNVLSTPAWMYKRATYADIHSGIGKLITMLKKYIR